MRGYPVRVKGMKVVVHRAHKRYTCSLCNGIIEWGDTYVQFKHSHRVRRYHLECFERKYGVRLVPLW